MCHIESEIWSHLLLSKFHLGWIFRWNSGAYLGCMSLIPPKNLPCWRLQLPGHHKHSDSVILAENQWTNGTRFCCPVVAASSLQCNFDLIYISLFISSRFKLPQKNNFDLTNTKPMFIPKRKHSNCPLVHTVPHRSRAFQVLNMCVRFDNWPQKKCVCSLMKDGAAQNVTHP